MRLGMLRADYLAALRERSARFHIGTEIEQRETPLNLFTFFKEEELPTVPVRKHRFFKKGSRVLKILLKLQRMTSCFPHVKIQEEALWKELQVSFKSQRSLMIYRLRDLRETGYITTGYDPQMGKWIALTPAGASYMHATGNGA